MTPRTPSIYSDEFWQEAMMNDTPKNDAKPEQPKLSAFEAAANTFIQNVVACTVNGLRSSIPQAPVANIMVKMCSAFGVSVGTAISIGLLKDILPMREACVEAFRQGIRSVKIEPPPPQTPKLN